jgi:hypothetical protein
MTVEKCFERILIDIASGDTIVSLESFINGYAALILNGDYSDLQSSLPSSSLDEVIECTSGKSPAEIHSEAGPVMDNVLDMYLSTNLVDIVGNYRRELREVSYQVKNKGPLTAATLLSNTNGDDLVNGLKASVNEYQDNIASLLTSIRAYNE